MATPKAKLNQLYVASKEQPCYSTFVGRPEEENAQSGTSFYCKLRLPDGNVVTSKPCRRKKDAEQDAARKALLSIGVPFEAEAPALGVVKPFEEVWIDLKLRIETAFSDECVLNYKPLMEHFRAAIVHKNLSQAAVPVTVLASLDTKIMSLCRALDRFSESDPARALKLVRSAAEACPSLRCREDLWISRVEPYSAYVKSGLLDQIEMPVQFDAVYIPVSSSTMVSAIEINLGTEDYYLDVLANKLGLEDGARVLISRSITKAPSGTRVFWSLSSDGNPTVNIRASSITGHAVFGNAILAAVGSTWKSEGRLCYDDVSLVCYFRLILSKHPSGCFKLSRGAVLTAELPCSYTSKTRWRGLTPRCILNEFCNQLHLLAPTFKTYPVRRPEAGDRTTAAAVEEDEASNSAQGPFICELEMFTSDGPRKFISERSYRNSNDAVQSACLKALLHLDQMVTESLTGCRELTSGGITGQLDFDVSGEAGEKPPLGCMVVVDFAASVKGAGINEVVEAQRGFEFELGSGSVLGFLDTCVANMSVGQTACFTAPPPSLLLLLAARELDGTHIARIMRGGWCLEYKVRLVSYVEAPEARMESAVFSPPLSKQRIDFALQVFQRSQATSLVDLGCGSGSFLEAMLEQQPQGLERVVGVDVSPKSLTRGSKSLQTKLSKLASDITLESVTLYEGSIAEPDLRLRDCDVATCLEVVEHMDPEPLARFGESVLGGMSPKLLVVSTPNIEYNPLLHARAHQEKAEQQQLQQEAPEAVRLRNDDHRFEWTRAEFSEWATGLAGKFGYSVTFSGVGGVAGQEPGYASQIAVFTRLSSEAEQLSSSSAAEPKDKAAAPYTQLWKWTRP